MRVRFLIGLTLALEETGALGLRSNGPEVASVPLVRPLTFVCVNHFDNARDIVDPEDTAALALFWRHAEIYGSGQAGQESAVAVRTYSALHERFDRLVIFVYGPFLLSTRQQRAGPRLLWRVARGSPTLLFFSRLFSLCSSCSSVQILCFLCVPFPPLHLPALRAFFSFFFFSFRVVSRRQHVARGCPTQ